MNALRAEADESAAKVEELSAKVRTLEQENLQKEQEITSLQHKNGVLEQEVDKLEGLHKDAKAAVDESAQHGTQNESLQRRLQLLEEEAEENDKNLRETNEKYVLVTCCFRRYDNNTDYRTGSARPMSRPATTSARSRLSSSPPTSGRRSTRTWPRSTATPRRSSTTSFRRLVTSERHPSSTPPVIKRALSHCIQVC